MRCDGEVGKGGPAGVEDAVMPRWVDGRRSHCEFLDAQLSACAAGRWSRRDGRWGKKAWRELAEDAIELRWPAVAGRTRARTAGAAVRVVAETKIKKQSV